VNLVIAGILMMGICVFIMASFPSTAAVLVGSIVLGLGVAYVLIPSQTLIQEETPHEMLGRVSSASLSLMTVSQLVAFLLAGAIAEMTGIIKLYYAVAAMLTATAVFGYLYARVNRVGETIAKAAPVGAETQSIE
jgi:MFS family permease